MGIEDIYARQRKEAVKDKLLVEVGGNFVVVNKSLKLSIKVGDNIMILEDEFKSSYDCKVCNGTGEVEVRCLKCDGLGATHPDDDDVVTCGRCDGKGFRVESCKACKGKGALLEIPDIAKARPTSGVIVSRGPTCAIYDLGARVCYSGYTGHLLPFKGNNRIRIMREAEAFCLIEDMPQTSTSEVSYDEIQFVDKDTAYDLT